MVTLVYLTHHVAYLWLALKRKWMLFSCYVACSYPLFAKLLLTKKKIDKQQLERNRLSLFLPTESYSILHLAFRIIAFLTYAQTRDGTA